MKVLIVHDRAEVATQIKDLLDEFLGNADETDVAEDYRSAYSYLSKSIYDFLLVDLTIPFEKGKASPDFKAVEQLLNELFKHDTLNVPGDVIGLTQDLSALDLVQNSLGPHVMVTIREDADGKWKDYLRDKIRYACRAARTRSVLVNRHFDYDALLLTAMDKEMMPFADIFELTDVSHFQGAREFVFTDKHGAARKGVTFSIGESGQASAASWAQSLLTYFRPRLALMSGYCGGVKGKVNFGDLILFKAAYAWDYGKWTEEDSTNLLGLKLKKPAFVSRPNPLSISGPRIDRIARDFVLANHCKQPKFLKKIEELSRGALSSVNVHFCPAASGSAVVANEEIVQNIRGLSDAIWAVDMECYGFYHSATHTQVIRPQFLCLKAVSDYCNGEKGDNLHEACSFISANAAEEILTRQWDFDVPEV